MPLIGNPCLFIPVLIKVALHHYGDFHGERHSFFPCVWPFFSPRLTVLQWRRCRWILWMNASNQLSSTKISMVVSSKHVNRFVLTNKGNMDNLKKWKQLTEESPLSPKRQQPPLPPQPLPSWKWTRFSISVLINVAFRHEKLQHSFLVMQSPSVSGSVQINHF